MNDSMLNRWAAARPHYLVIMDFLEWLNDNNLPFLIVDGEGKPTSCSVDELLDEYLDIDRAKLESERRALLDHSHKGEGT